MQEIIIIIITNNNNNKSKPGHKDDNGYRKRSRGWWNNPRPFLPQDEKGKSITSNLTAKATVSRDNRTPFCILFHFIILFFSNSTSFLFVDRQIQDQTLPDKSTQKSQKRLTLQAVYVADETRRDERRRDEGQGGGKWKRWGKSQKKKKKSGKGRGATWIDHARQSGNVPTFSSHRPGDGHPLSATRRGWRRRQRLGSARDGTGQWSLLVFIGPWICHCPSEVTLKVTLAG